VAFVRIIAAEEYITFIIEVKRIRELGTMLAVTMSLLKEPQGVTSQNGILDSHWCENLKIYIP
jgi:hypothetical protein